MFRIESYITSIILSYVDRYIKNFRRQDAQKQKDSVFTLFKFSIVHFFKKNLRPQRFSQLSSRVSIWEGDGSFQNLNLDLEVLEQELNLPLSFVSGHIHELRIHVPWTRLASEPVQITINTIECVMKLKPPGSQPTFPHVDTKTPRLNPEEAPPSYISSLVNKIIFNLSITCNNLILKYVEEDIVLSMNIKTLSLGTVNADWKPEFSELSPSQLVLRKLISLADVTVCLDKRNASGRIESYLEPLLYRCFMTVRLSRTYPSVNALRATTTHLDIFCEKMAFTLSEPQVPMIMRLIALALALNRKQFTSQVSVAPTSDNIQGNPDADTMATENNVADESWSSWAMSWVPSIYPLVGEENEYSSTENVSSPYKNTFHFGFYVNTFSLALKLCEPEVAGSGKYQCNAFLHILLHGCRSDLTSHDTNWTNVQMGISQATIQPAGDCCCGTSEANETQLPYLSCGKVQESFLLGSLFSNNQYPVPTEATCTWDYHLAVVTETMLLEKTPAFAIDYLFCSVTPELYDNDDEEIERLPPKERVLVRYVAGPMVVRVCSGLIHRIQMVMKAAATYDYSPYGSAAQLPVVDKNVLNLSEHLAEGHFDWEEELISCYFPSHVSQFTAFNTTIEFYPANHLPVHQSVLGRKLSRPQKRAQNSMPAPSSPPPCVTLEWKCVYATLTRPYNPDKWLQMANCFESGKIPDEIIVTAQTRLAFKVVGVISSLNIPHGQPMKVLEMSSLACDQTSHYMLKRLDKDINSDLRAQIESITVTSSKAKLLLLTEIVSSLFATNNKLKHQVCYNIIYNSSLIKDATKITETIYLKINLDDLILRRVLTALSETTHLSVGALQAFMVRLPEKGPETETMILNAPDTENSTEFPFIGVVFQCPVGNSIYPPVLSFKFREMRLSIDPLLYDWLLYIPISSPTPLAKPHIMKSWTSVDSIKMRKVSESSLSSHARRAVTPQESVHSSSERETIPSAHPSSLPVLEAVQPVPLLPLSERISGLFPVWKSLVISGDILQWNIYLPNYSLAQITTKSMESSLQAGLKNTAHKLQVVVIKLPMITLQCASNKQNLVEFTHTMPVVLPETMWTPEKNNFPWLLNVTDLHCYTLHGAKCLQLLKPVTVNCTITTSPKFSAEVLTSLALCVHLHTIPVAISISEEQVALLAGLAMIHAKVYTTLATSWALETVSSEESLVSVKLISSDESLSTSQPGEESAEGAVQSGVKLTAWFQWLIARITLNIYSIPTKHSQESLKLTLDVEDIILSLDVEKVYHKIKLKVATASICHYTRKSLKHSWILGAFKGLVMRGYDPEGVNVSNTSKHPTEDASVPSGFLTATLTRARCSNLHSRIGTPSKNTSISKKSSSNIEVQNSFITEIVVKLQPLDFVLSPATLGTFFHVLDPLVSVSGAGNGTSTTSSPSSLTAFTTSSLPLLYLDLMAIRIMFPASQCTKKCQHDVLIFQLDGMVVNPQPENPICRTPLRQDIYHMAEKHRILNIPGSEVEDRQYQIDLISIRVNTGMWYELEYLLSQDPTDSVVQNPALDWNEGRSPNAPTPKLLSPIITPFNLCLVLAPAILYRNSVVVSGHSAEINAVSEINVKLSLDQLHLCSVLTTETTSVISTSPRNTRLSSDPVQRTHQNLPENPTTPSLHLDCDSGFESVESSIHTIVKRVDPNMAAVHSVTSSGVPLHTSLPSPQPFLPLHKVNIIIPMELLITGNAFSFGILRKEQKDDIVIVEPFLYLLVSQPHLFMSKVGETTKWQASIFDLSIRSGKNEHFVNSDQLSAKSYPQSLVKTRNGDPDPVTGIPPALLTAKWTQIVNRPPKVDIEMGRPVRVSCSINILEYFRRIQSLLSDSLKVVDLEEESKRISQGKDTKVVKDEMILGEIKSDQSLHEYLTYFSHISLNTQQLVLAVLSRNESSGGLSVSVNQVSACLASTFSLQQTVTGSATLDNFTVATRTPTGRCPQLLVNPWTFSLETSLSWESWIPAIYSPVIHVMVDSDVLAIDVSPDQLQRLQEIITEYSTFFSKPQIEKNEELSYLINTSASSPSCEEQHYHDDIQAGAFQFVDSSGGREDLPQTYQVVFWSGQVGTTAAPTMAWKYPQPRALTKLHIQPIPFRINSQSNYIFVCDQDSNTDNSVKCTLQYYNDNQSSYRDYVEFFLSESEICVVTLPTHLPKLAVATTWRVVLGSSDFDFPPIPVKALAASLRVDSYFAPLLVPSVQLGINLSSLQVSLWSQVNSIRPLPEPLSRYIPDGCFPLDHDFLTASLDQANISFIMWPKKSKLVTVNGRPRLDIVSYVTLSKQCCIPPFPLMADFFSSPLNVHMCSLVTGSIYLRLGPAICHTLSSSLSMWLQYTSNKPRYQILLTPFVICNNSCLSIKVGQAGTDEVIPLQCLQCHLYSWRTTKAKLLMRFSLLDTDEGNWSQGLALNKEGSQIVKMKDKANREFVLVVTVKKISSAVYQVIVGGQLVLRNSLSSSLELRIIPDDPEQRQASLVVQSNTTPPSIILDSQLNVSLRIRFSALSGAWSGLIPLKNEGSKTKQWLVKVPLKEKGQFRSVWCRVVWDSIQDVQRILVVISPMYTIRSLLPCEASVVIETPELKSTKSVTVSGRGAAQDLDCPGLSESLHQLTFQLDGRAPASSPHVPLSYPMMEGNTPPPKPLNLEMDSLLDTLYNQGDDNTWPFLGPDWTAVEWIQTTQPDTVTHVKVRFTEECAHGNSLLVELQPWALLLNTLGCHVYLQASERIVCSVPHCAVISPPLLESTFQIGVDIGASFHLSSALQLSRDRGFYMPRISGLIAPSGHINTCIDCITSLCYANVSSSEIEGVRLIHVRSSYVIANVSSQELKVTPLAVRRSVGDVNKHTMPCSVVKNSLLLKPQLPTSKLKCQPITEWHTVGSGDVEIIPYLVVSVNDVHSCPVRIPEGPDKQSMPVLLPVSNMGQNYKTLLLTSQSKDGQTYLLLWDQPWPQITIQNETKSTIVFSKAQNEQGKEAALDSEDWAWRLHVPAGSSAHYHLPPLGPPELGPPYLLPPVVIAIDMFYPAPNQQELKWSDPINLSTCNGRLLTLSGLPEICMSITKRGFTTYVSLMQASHTEVLAVDIRGQLSRDIAESRRFLEPERNALLATQLSEISSSQGTTPNVMKDDSFKTSLESTEQDDAPIGTALETSIDFTCFIRSFTSTLLAQSDNGCDCREVAALTFDQVGITLHPQPLQNLHVKEMKVCVTMSDIQLDNQEYHSGGYDFPVVLMKRVSSESINNADFNVNQNACTLVTTSRENNPVVDIKVVVDMNSHESPAVQDISLQLLPLQLYVEDTFAIHLKDCLNDIIPEYLLSEVTPSSSLPSSLQKQTKPSVLQNMNEQPGGSSLSLHTTPKENVINNTTVISTNEVDTKVNPDEQEEDLFNVSEPDLDVQHEEVESKSKVESDIKPTITEVESGKLNRSDTLFESEMLWSVPRCRLEEQESTESSLGIGRIPIPSDILAALQELARPLRLRSLSISEFSLLVSVHTSTRFYIALDHSPLYLAAFQRSSLVTTAYRLGHALTLHYFLGAIYGTGWAIGSLELLGAPGGLARTLGSGLRDFVSLPYRGILLGPRAFLVGIAHGSASLMKHITAGTVTSVTKLAASWARTLDRLTLDNEGLQHSEELRRLRPHGLTQGFVQGLTEFGISILGAVGSIVHHPLQYMISDDPDRSLVNSIGLGLVGMITRPLSGAAELVALTGEGLLSGVGWSNTPRARHQPVMEHSQCGTDSELKYLWKLLLPSEQLLLITEATTDCYEPVTLLITNNTLYVVNTELDIVVRAAKLVELRADANRSDPTLVAFHILPPNVEAEALSRSRVAEFVRESQRVLIGDMTSPNLYTSGGETTTELCDPPLQFYISPQARDHFLAVLSFVTRHANGRGFPLIS